MKLPAISRLLVLVAVFATVDNGLVFGHIFEGASSPEKNLFAGMVTARKSQAGIFYARINGENVHMTFDDNNNHNHALVHRQDCVAGDTCAATCSNCGLVSCGPETADGSCECSDSLESCAGDGKGQYCGRATTCEQACSFCEGATWCGTYFKDHSCECANKAGKCSGGPGFSIPPLPSLSIPTLSTPIPSTPTLTRPLPTTTRPLPGTTTSAITSTTSLDVVSSSPPSTTAKTSTTTTERATTTSSATTMSTAGSGDIPAAAGRTETAVWSLMLELGVFALAFQL